jgi:hypothetical protein
MEERLKKILNNVAEIGQMVEQMKKGGPLPLIEIDLVLEKTRNLYEDIQGLKKAPDDKAARNTAKETPPPPPAPEPPVQEPPVREPAVSEDLIEPPEPETESKEDPGILADRYMEGKKFINETLSRKDQDISSKLQSKPIKDISSALGINDRFKLIKDLFNGDKESFEKTIAILDDADNFNDAFSYINSTFDWDMEDEPVLMLLELVRRKFIVNQDEQAGT